MKIITFSVNLFKFKALLLLNIIPFLLVSCSKGQAEVNDHHAELATSTILMAKYNRPLKDITYEVSAKRLSRGKYLTEGLHCMGCHTERDETQPGWPVIMEKKFSGALRYKTDSTWLYAPNLTPDKETGIGNFTDDMIARALREGIGHDGRALVPPGKEGMPWRAFRALSDEDLASIICYLRSVPAIRNEIPKRNIGEQQEKAIVGRSYPLETGIAEPNHSDPLSLGTYLVTLGECMGCHTNWGKHNSGVFGGGLNFTEQDKDPLFTPNISSDATGIGKWSKEAFVHVMKTGKGGTLNKYMPWAEFRNLTDEDLGAIYEALMTTYPVDHAVLNRVPISFCAACDREHGLGDQNQKNTIKPFKENYKIPEDLAGTYFNTSFKRDTVRIYYEEGKLLINNRKQQIIPLSESTYISEVPYAPLVFTRNSEGIATGFRFQILKENYFQKIN